MSRESSGITYQRNGGDHMISLTGSFNYYFCTEPVTLRYRHRGLREYIKSKLHRDPTNGDVFIFLSRDYSRLRIYYFHHNGEILTEKIMHKDRYVRPVFGDNDKSAYHMAWSDFVYLLEGVIRKDKREFFEECESIYDDSNI